MRKSLQELLDEGLVEEFTSTPEQIQEQIRLAVSDLTAANIMISDSHLAEWAYKAAYNSMLSAARALLFSRRYRAKISGTPHKATVQFIQAEYGDKIDSTAISAFSKARLDRHESQYEQVGTITPNQAQFLTTQADIFLKTVKELLNQS